MTQQDCEGNKALTNALTRRQMLKLSALGFAATAGLLSACGGESGGGEAGGGGGDGVTLRHITYIDWIGEGEYADFKRETGIKVVQVVANVGEDRLAKIQGDPEAADFVLADFLFAGRLDGLGLLAKLDFASIENYEHVDPAFKIGFASPEVAKLIPTDFGRTGIVYRTDVVKEGIETWADFFALAPKYSRKVSLLDFEESVLNAALIASGHGANTTDSAELDEAVELLIAAKPHILALITSDQAKPLLDGSAVMGQMDDFAAAGAVTEDARLTWVDPKDGIYGYLEGWAALKASSHVREVEQFMNYHLQPEVTANFINTLAIPSIMPAASEYVSPEIKNNPVTNPDASVFSRVTFSEFLGEDQKKYDEAWARFRSA